MNLRNFNPRKIIKTRDSVFALHRTTIPHRQSDVEFHGESYDGYHVTVAHCAKKFCTKTLKKVEKIHENSSIFKKF